jgi:integrase
VHDYVLFLANTGLRPDEAKNLQHRDVAIVEGDTILEIEVRGKRGIGFCKSMPSAVRPYERLVNRPKPVQVDSRREQQRRRREGLPQLSDEPPPLEYPDVTDPVFPGNHVKLFNGGMALNFVLGGVGGRVGGAFEARGLEYAADVLPWQTAGTRDLYRSINEQRLIEAAARDIPRSTLAGTGTTVTGGFFE